MPTAPIQPLSDPKLDGADWWQVLQQARANLEARGSGFRTQDEIEAEHESFRAERDEADEGNV